MSAGVWLWLAAVTMLVTAFLHSFLGERRLISPMLDLKTGVLAVPLARQVVRFAWHLTSALMAACALAMLIQDTPVLLIAVIGFVWVAAGLSDAVYTRGKHVGWPILTAAGVFALLGAWE